jgi:hypothetical protein
VASSETVASSEAMASSEAAVTTPAAMAPATSAATSREESLRHRVSVAGVAGVLHLWLLHDLNLWLRELLLREELLLEHQHRGVRLRRAHVERSAHVGRRSLVAVTGRLREAAATAEPTASPAAAGRHVARGPDQLVHVAARRDVVHRGSALEALRQTKTVRLGELLLVVAHARVVVRRGRRRHECEGICGHVLRSLVLGFWFLVRGGAAAPP